MAAWPHDEELLDALYAEYAGPLLEYVERLLGGDRFQAEDVVQETLMRAWRNADALATETARPWLFTVARRLVIDRYRGTRRRPPSVASEAAIEALPAPDELEGALLAWEVAEALRSLSPDHRRVLLEIHYATARWPRPPHSSASPRGRCGRAPTTRCALCAWRSRNGGSTP